MVRAARTLSVRVVFFGRIGLGLGLGIAIGTGIGRRPCRRPDSFGPPDDMGYSVLSLVSARGLVLRLELRPFHESRRSVRSDGALPGRNTGGMLFTGSRHIV